MSLNLDHTLILLLHCFDMIIEIFKDRILEVPIDKNAVVQAHHREQEVPGCRASQCVQLPSLVQDGIAFH